MSFDVDVDEVQAKRRYEFFFKQVRENETNSSTMLKSSANPCKDQPNANDGIVLAELESQPLPKSNYCPTKMALLVGQANQASQAKQA